MPVPQSWYATNNNTITPALISPRPIAPSTRANLMADSMDRSGAAMVAARPKSGPNMSLEKMTGLFGMLVGARAGLRGDSAILSLPWLVSATCFNGWLGDALSALDPYPQPLVTEDAREPAVQVHDAVVLLGRFPALAGLDLTLDAVLSPWYKVQMVLARRPFCDCLRAWRRWRAERQPCLATMSRPRRGQVRASVGLLSPATMLYEELTIKEKLVVLGHLVSPR